MHVSDQKSLADGMRDEYARWTAELSAKKYFIAYFTTPASDIAGEIATAIDSTNDCIRAAVNILPRRRKKPED